MNEILSCGVITAMQVESWCNRSPSHNLQGKFGFFVPNLAALQSFLLEQVLLKWWLPCVRGEQGHSEGGQGLKPRIVLKIMTAKISGGGREKK